MSDDPRRGGRRRAYVAGDATGSARGWAAPATAELFEPPRSSALIRTAKTMARDHPDLAVITAQVAVEFFVERAFDALCRSHVSEDLAAAIVGCIPDRSLMSSETRALWEALIDQRLSKKTVPTRRLTTSMSSCVTASCIEALTSERKLRNHRSPPASGLSSRCRRPCRPRQEPPHFHPR